MIKKLEPHPLVPVIYYAVMLVWACVKYAAICAYHLATGQW